jgi:hypothetical protein
MTDKATNVTILDLDALMDLDMGSVETLPDYVSPAAGSYVLGIADVTTKAPKEGEKDKPSRIVLTYKIEETVECTEAPFPNGSLFTESFQATSEGVTYFKKQAVKLLASDLEGASMRDVFSGLKEMGPFKAVITTRTTKDAATGKEYTNINVRPIHDPA